MTCFISFSDNAISWELKCWHGSIKCTSMFTPYSESGISLDSDEVINGNIPLAGDSLFSNLWYFYKLDANLVGMLYFPSRRKHYWTTCCITIKTEAYLVSATLLGFSMWSLIFSCFYNSCCNSTIKSSVSEMSCHYKKETNLRESHAFHAIRNLKKIWERSVTEKGVPWKTVAQEWHKRVELWPFRLNQGRWYQQDLSDFPSLKNRNWIKSN